MTDDGDDVAIVDEALRDRAGSRAIAGIVGELDLETPPAGPGRAAVDFVERQLNALLVCEPVSAAERPRGAEGDRAGLPVRAGRK